MSNQIETLGNNSTEKVYVSSDRFDEPVDGLVARIRDCSESELRCKDIRFAKCDMCLDWIAVHPQWQGYSYRFCQDCLKAAITKFPRDKCLRKYTLRKNAVRAVADRIATRQVFGLQQGDPPVNRVGDLILMVRQELYEVAYRVKSSGGPSLAVTPLLSAVVDLEEAANEYNQYSTLILTFDVITREKALQMCRDARMSVRSIKAKVSSEVRSGLKERTLQKMTCVEAAVARALSCLNEWWPVVEVAGVTQMEGMESILASAAKPVIEKGMGFVGESIRDMIGSSKRRDAPALVESTPLDFSIGDLPKQVKSLSIKKESQVPDFGDVCQTVGHDSQSLLERCKVRSLLGNFSWPVASAAGTKLYSVGVNPAVFPSGSATFKNNTILSYLSEFYQYWRGELIYTFEVICTKFHQGQLFIVFDPSNSTTNTLATSTNCLCATIDLGLNNRTDFTIPFVSDSDYKFCPEAYFGTDPTASNNAGAQTGRLTVFVQNALLAPPSVAPAITVNVYIRAADTFQFAVPRTPQVFVDVDGIRQGDEVLSTDASNVEVGSAQDSVVAVNPISAVSTWKTADTANVMGREYLLRTGISWAGTVGRGANLTTVSLPNDLITDTDIGVSGLTTFHAYVRFGIRFTLKFNASPFYAGLVCMYFNPSPDPIDVFDYYTVFQLPHVMLNPAGEQTVSLDVPWAYWKRLRATFSGGSTPSWGTLGVVVISPLLSPPSAVNALEASLWFTLKEPYVGVKRVPGVPQGDRTTDSAQDVAQVERKWDQDSTTPPGYLGDHMDVRTLLHRPAFASLNNFVLAKPGASNVGLHAYMTRFTTMTGKEQLKLVRLWRFWSGSRRIHLVSPWCVSNMLMIEVIPQFTPPYNVAPVGAIEKRWNGMQIWRPGSEPAAVFQVPFYHYTPLVPCPTTAARDYVSVDSDIAVIYLYAYYQNDVVPRLGTDQDEWFTFEMYSSAGDDFELYMPLAVPSMYASATVAEGEPAKTYVSEMVHKFSRQGSEWERDLTREGVESNPGPVLSKPSFSKFVSEHYTAAPVRRLAADGGDEDLTGIHIRDLDCMFDAYVAARPSPSRLGTLWQNCLDLITRTVSRRVANKAKTKLNSLKDDFSRAIVPSMIWAIDFILNVYIISTSESTVARALALTSLGAKCVMAYRHGSLLLDKLTEVINDPVTFINQGDEDMDKHRDIAMVVSAALLAGIIGVMGWKVHSTDIKNIKDLSCMRFAEACGGMSKIASGVKGVNYLWTATVSGTKAAMDYFIDGESMFTTWYDMNRSKLTKWMADWDQLRADGSSSNNSVFKGVAGSRPYDKMLKLCEFAKEVRKNGALLKTFPMAYMRTAEAIIERVNALTEVYQCALGRHEPVGVLVYGKPGCGKSFMTTTVLPRVVLQELELAQTTEDCKSKIYCKPRDPDQKFMDGYVAQPWFVIDDFGQNTDDKDFAEIINLISVSNCPVPMARLEEKNTMMDSSFVVATTNLTSYHGINTIKEPTAVARRFKIGIELSPKEEKFDAEAFVADMRATDVFAAAAKHWVIEPHDFEKPNVKYAAITFAELCRRICAEYRKRMRVKASLNLDMGADKFTLPAVNVAGWNLREAAVVVQGDSEDTEVKRVSMKVRRSQWVNEVQNSTPEAYSSLMDQVLLGQDEFGDYLHDEDFMAVYERVQQTSRVDDEEGTKWPGLAKQLLTVFAAVAAAGLVVTLLVRLFRSTFNYFFGVVQQGGYEKSDKIIPKKVIQVKGVKSVFHGESDKHVAIHRNVRRVQMLIDGECWGMNALAMDSRHLLVPLHFYERYVKETKANKSVILQLEMVDRLGTRVGFRAFGMSSFNVQAVTGPEMFHNCNLDLVVVRLTGANVDHARDIKGMIKTMEDFRNLMGTELESHFLGVRNSGCKAVMRFKYLVSCENLYAFPGKVAVASKFGDCGRPYVSANVADQRPLMGLHVVWIPKDEMVGMVPLIRECVDIALAKLDKNVRAPVDIVEVKDEEFEFTGDKSRFWKSAIENHGETKFNGTSLVRHVMDTTQFERTFLRHKDWSDGFEPSQKKVVSVGGELIHPLYTNAQKYEPTANFVVPTQVHNVVVEFMKKRIQPLTDYETLSEDDSINGFNNMTPLVMNTSPGYWSQYFSNGKKEIFDAKPQEENERGETMPLAYIFSVKAKTNTENCYKRSFVDHMQWCREQLALGSAIPTFWTSTLKDELRASAKVAIGKTRVFEQPGLEFTLLMRQYYGHFINHYKLHSGFKLFHGIGNDKEKVWAAYWRELNAWDGVGFDLDYSNFDGTVSVNAFDAFLELTDHYYGEKDRNARHALLHSLRSSILLVGRDCVETVQGNKSGNPITDMFNSICGSYYILVFYVLAREMYGLDRSLDDFDDNVRFLTYGDDVIVSCSPRVRNFFNRKVCIEIARELGLGATNAAKNGVVEESNPLSELTFLKSPFVECDGVVLAPLPKEVIYRELMWQHKQNRGDKRIMEQRVETALRMMAHHGKEATEELVKQLKECGVSTEFDWHAWFVGIRDLQQFVEVERVDGSRDMIPDVWEVPDDWQQWLKTEQVEWLKQGDEFVRVVDTMADVMMVQNSMVRYFPPYVPPSDRSSCIVGASMLAVPLGALLSVIRLGVRQIPGGSVIDTMWCSYRNFSVARDFSMFMHALLRPLNPGQEVVDDIPPIDTFEITDLDREREELARQAYIIEGIEPGLTRLELDARLDAGFLVRWDEMSVGSSADGYVESDGTEEELEPLLTYDVPNWLEQTYVTNGTLIQEEDDLEPRTTSLVSCVAPCEICARRERDD